MANPVIMGLAMQFPHPQRGQLYDSREGILCLIKHFTFKDYSGDFGRLAQTFRCLGRDQIGWAALM